MLARGWPPCRHYDLETRVSRPGTRAFALLTGIALASAPPDATAQGAMATLRGRVTDQQGGVVPGAAVTVRSTETNASRTVLAGSAGETCMRTEMPASRSRRAVSSRACTGGLRGSKMRRTSYRSVGRETPTSMRSAIRARRSTSRSTSGARVEKSPKRKGTSARIASRWNDLLRR